MAGRKHKSLSGPFAQLLERHNVAPHELAERIGKNVQSLYLVADGTAQRIGKLAQAIAEALAIPPDDVLAVIERQRRYVEQSRLADATQTVLTHLSAAPPTAKDAMPYGPTRDQLRLVAEHATRWLGAGYGQPKLPPRKLAAKQPENAA